MTGVQTCALPILLSPNENILIADEPLRFVDRDRIQEATLFIRKLCERLKFQLLVVSHIPEMIQNSEAVYQIDKVNKVSTAKKIN